MIDSLLLAVIVAVIVLLLGVHPIVALLLGVIPVAGSIFWLWFSDRRRDNGVDTVKGDNEKFSSAMIDGPTARDYQQRVRDAH